MFIPPAHTPSRVYVQSLSDSLCLTLPYSDLLDQQSDKRKQVVCYRRKLPRSQDVTTVKATWSHETAPKPTHDSRKAELPQNRESALTLSILWAHLCLANHSHKIHADAPYSILNPLLPSLLESYNSSLIQSKMCSLICPARTLPFPKLKLSSFYHPLTYGNSSSLIRKQEILVCSIKPRFSQSY